MAVWNISGTRSLVVLSAFGLASCQEGPLPADACRLIGSAEVQRISGAIIVQASHPVRPEGFGGIDELPSTNICEFYSADAPPSSDHGPFITLAVVPSDEIRAEHDAEESSGNRDTGFKKGLKIEGLGDYAYYRQGMILAGEKNRAVFVQIAYTPDHIVDTDQSRSVSIAKEIARIALDWRPHAG